MKKSLALVLGASAVVGVAAYHLLDDVEIAEPPDAQPVAPAAPSSRPTPRAIASTTIARREEPTLPAAPEPTRDQAKSSRELHEQLQTSFASSALGDTYHATSGLEATIRRTLPEGSALRTVTCRGAMCRVETTHQNADEFRAFVQATFDASSTIPTGPAYASIVETPASGPVVAVAFLSQSGTELPLN